MGEADQHGGKKVWTRRFLDRYAPLLHLASMANRLQLHDGTQFAANDRMSRAGATYRGATFNGVSYRIAPEGVLVGTFSASFSGADYSVQDVVRSLAAFRSAAFTTFRTFIEDYFSVEDRRRALESSIGVLFGDPTSFLSEEMLRGEVDFHSLVLMEEFTSIEGDGSRCVVPIESVVQSVELAGILNEATWFELYAPEYCQRIRLKQIGYRRDEIYVTDRRTTVIVSGKFWKDGDPLKFYKQDVQLAIAHFLSRSALAKQQAAFYRDHEDVRPLLQEPLQALPLVLAGRASLTLLHESLDFGVLVRHGFTRKFAEGLGEEMDLVDVLTVIEKRVTDMSEAINLKSSILAADSARRIASQNVRLQWIVTVMTVLAVIATVTFGLMALF